MKKKKVLLVCCIFVLCAGILALGTSLFNGKGQEPDSEAFVYDSEYSAIMTGTQETFREWKSFMLTANESQRDWTANKEKIAVKYTVEGINYYLIYIDYAGDHADYLDFFLAEVKEKQGKFSFKRVSVFYGVIPDKQRETDEKTSDVASGSTAKGDTVKPLYFTCAKVKGKDRVFVDDKKMQGPYKKSNLFNLKIFGIIDSKEHTVEVE